MQIKMVKEGMTTIINHNVAAINNVAAISSAAVTSSVVATSSKVAAIVNSKVVAIVSSKVAAIVSSKVAATVSKAVTNKVVAISDKVATRNAHNASKVHAQKCALCHVLSQ